MESDADGKHKSCQHSLKIFGLRKTVMNCHEFYRGNS